MAEDKKILIIEDEEPLLDSYAKLVEMAGYIAVKASDGYQGLDILANNLDQIDLVLLDLMMPGVDGLEVLKTIKNNEEKELKLIGNLTGLNETDLGDLTFKEYKILQERLTDFLS